MPSRCLVIAAAFVATSAAASPAHPHLFFEAGDVATLRAHAQGTHKDIFQALKGGTDFFLNSRVANDGTVSWTDGSRASFNLGDRRDVGDSLIVFSFVWTIDGSDKYLQLAKNWLSDVISWSTLDLDPTGTDAHDLIQEQILAAVAVAYDLLYAQLSTTDRTRILAVIQQNANAVLAVNNWWETEYLQNHNWINHASLGLAALAIEGDLAASVTDPWRKYATANVKKIYTATSGITDGTWHEGISYLGYGYTWQLPYLFALERAGYEDLTDFPMLHGAGKFLAHGQIPEQPAASVLTYGDFFGFGMDVGSLRYAASRYHDGFAQLVANRYTAGTKRGGYAPESVTQVFEFLYYDPSVPETDLGKEPLDWYGSDLGAVIFRSGWNAGGTLFALKAGTYGGRSVWDRLGAGDKTVGALNFGHDHPDDNGFYLYGNGAWLAPEAEGYGAGNANFTWFHNSLTVDGQSQLGSGAHANGDESQSYPWFATREASIPFHGSSTDFAYATGEGAHLYAGSLGLTRWDRHALFLDRKWVVLRDVLESTQSHNYAWFCHFMESAAREGSWIHGRGDSGQSLGVAVVAPADWTFGASEQTLPYLDRLEANGQVAAATVTPATQANVNLLTVLVPVAEANWAARPLVAPLDSAARDAGLTLTDGNRVAAAIFGKLATDETRAGGYHLAGQAGVAEYVSGQPDRALLIRGTLLEDSSRILLNQDGTSTVLEADGLGSSVVSLSGDVLKQATLYAPKATRVTWYGADVAFTRSGDYLSIQSAVPIPAGGDSSNTTGTSGSSRHGCSTGVAEGGLALLGLAAARLLRRRRRVIS